MSTRRALPLLLATLSLAAAPADQAGDGGTGPEAAAIAARVRSLAERATRIASIEPGAEDFSDLLPLAAGIGTARVVMLGEATHGDGETFHAKGRLIRFLHQNMGFDVLAWEAGFFDCRDVDIALRGDGPLGEAALLGLYGLWWRSAQVEPTLAYVRHTQATHRPITTVGFDSRVSTESARNHRFPEFVFAFFDRLDAGLISPAERRDLTAMSVGLVPKDYYENPGSRAYNRELPQRLIATLDARRGELRRHYAEREIDFARQTLISLLNMDRALPAEPERGNPDGYGRDAAMAENLLWHLDGPLAGRKVIVWAHNYHILRDLLWPERMPAERLHAGPMGRFLSAALGDELYTVAFLSHGGEWGYAGEEAEALPVPAAGSLADLLHRLGLPYLFLDLRGLPSGHWLRDPLEAGFSFHEPSVADWPRLYDAVFFIDRMRPAHEAAPGR